MIGLTLLGWALGVAVVSLVAVYRARGRYATEGRPPTLPGRLLLEHAPREAPVSLLQGHPAIELSEPRGPLALQPPPVRKILLVRPCAGLEPHLRQALTSSRQVSELSAPGYSVQVVFALSDATDSAFPLALEVAQELRASGCPVEVVQTLARGLNAKSAQLAAVTRQFPYDWLLSCDSDVELRKGELPALLAPLLEAPSPCAACWAPTGESDLGRTLGDRASQALLGGSLHSFPLLAGLDARGLVGKVLAIRRDALECVGGFEALTTCLGEDMELASRLHRQGLSIVAAPFAAQSVAAGRSLFAVMERFARWVQVIRAQRPWLLLSYPLLFCATPLLTMGALLVASWDPLMGFSIFAITLAVRATVALAAREATGRARARQDLWLDVLLADLLLLTSFVTALFRRSVVWRGRLLTISQGKLMSARSLPKVARWFLSSLLALSLIASTALALPKPGDPGLNVKVQDADDHEVQLKDFTGKPILIVYEDKGSSQQNDALKKELSKLAKGDKYKDKVALAAIADVSAYNYWPVKGFVKDAIREESKKAGTTIYCDWDASVRKTYDFPADKSSIVLIDKNGWVIFSGAGALGNDERARLIELLKKQVEDK